MAEEAERQKRLLEQYRREKLELESLLSEIQGFNDEFTRFLGSNKYLCGYDIFSFKAHHQKLYTQVSIKSYKHLPDFDAEIKTLETFLWDYHSLGQRTADRNSRFLTTELDACGSLFDDVEGRSLDAQQRMAILTDQDNNLVIAGAGSGKTTTIAGKVKYLTKRLQVAPEHILLISFTRKSADEMSERIRKNMGLPLPVKTFHKLGLDIISEARGEKPSVLDLSQKQFLELLQSFLNNSKVSDQYFDKLMDFLSFYLKPYKDIQNFTTDAEHNNYLKEQKLEGYKMVEKITAEGAVIRYRERFKSQEEVLIGNFLFRNGIRYEYEEKYQYKTASKKFGQYKPDFYLPDHDIYIEHFGINEDGQVPGFFKGTPEVSAQQRYTAGMEWKRNEHKFNGTTLIETYSWEQRQGILLDRLREKLEEKEVIFNPIPNEELWKYLQENANEDIEAFTQLLNTFLSLFKSNNESLTKLRQRAVRDGEDRAALFLELFEPVLHSYENYLQQMGDIDFSDMINSATESVRTESFLSPYHYIIIDEFQDISQSRFQLIKALLDQRPDTRLLCVGDDWQSIYRFAGSDIGIFTGFANYFKSSVLPGFERSTNTSYIEQTYRFDNQLISLSENFILKNPNQMRKSLKSNKVSDAIPYTIHKYSDEQRDGGGSLTALYEALEMIIEREPGGAGILLLGRYDFDRKVFQDDTAFTKQYDKSTERYNYYYKGNRQHCINFMTVHSSKGLESDYVIILNCNSGTYGFPSEISDDPLLNFLLSKADHFPNGEERRLFYVAMTRARKHVHVITSLAAPSKFVSEIEDIGHVTAFPCEWCDNGRLIERTGPFGLFYACNNNHYCNYTRKATSEDVYQGALRHMEAKEYDAAITYLERALEAGNPAGETHYRLGRCHYEKKESLQAIGHYDNAIAAGYMETDAFYYRGLAHLAAKQFREAVADFEYVLEKKGEGDSIHSLISFACFKAGHVVKAFEHIDRELELNPRHQHALRLKGEYMPILEKRFTSKEVKIGASDAKTIKGYIELAIRFGVNIRFDYHKSEQFDGGEQSHRTIRPAEIKMVGNSRCVGGFCHMRNEDRTFAIDRISKLVLNPASIIYWSEDQGRQGIQ